MRDTEDFTIQSFLNMRCWIAVTENICCKNFRLYHTLTLRWDVTTDNSNGSRRERNIATTFLLPQNAATCMHARKRIDRLKVQRLSIGVFQIHKINIILRFWTGRNFEFTVNLKLDMRLFNQYTFGFWWHTVRTFELVHPCDGYLLLLLKAHRSWINLKSAIQFVGLLWRHRQ